MKPVQLLLMPTLLLLQTTVFAQQPVFSQFSEAYALLNPAYIATDNLSKEYNWFVSAVGRSQWSKIEGAPNSGLLRLNYVSSNINSTGSRMSLANTSVGGYLVWEEIGDFKVISLNGHYAYIIDFKNNHFLTLGIGLGITQQRIKTSAFDHQSFTIDPTVGDYATLLNANISAGFSYNILFDRERHFFFNFSASPMGSFKIFAEASELFNEYKTTNFAVSTGLLFPIGADNLLSVTLISQASKGINFQADGLDVPPLTSAFVTTHLNQLWLGLGLSSNNTATLQGGYYFYAGTDSDLKLSFSYVVPFYELYHYLGNTFELGLTYSW